MNRSMKRASNAIEEELQKWFSGFQRVVVTGVGNPLRKDDFVGVKIVRQLKDKVSSYVHLIECETVPESFLGSIIELDPTHILIIDAAMLNSEIGSSRLVSPKELDNRQAVSTHVLPLQIFCEYLAQTIEAKIALLVIQPKDTSFGEGLTAELETVAERFVNLLSKILNK